MDIQILVRNNLRNIILFIIGSASLNASAIELLRSTESWNGGAFHYPSGKAEITSVKIKLEKGQETPFHCHPVPTMGYVLKGKIEVITMNGDKAVLREGDAVVEAMSTLHKGRSLGGPAELVVFYAGDTNTLNTIFPEEGVESKYCDKP